MRSLEASFSRTLRQVYFTERQLSTSLAALCVAELRPELVTIIERIEIQSREQALRLEEVFSTLCLKPRTEATGPTTALLREAWIAVTELDDEPGMEGCAASLLALKRYELSLYERLYRWSERCELDEILPPLRLCIVEELLQAAVLSQIAYSVPHITSDSEIRLRQSRRDPELSSHTLRC